MAGLSNTNRIPVMAVASTVLDGGVVRNVGVASGCGRQQHRLVSIAFESQPFVLGARSKHECSISRTNEVSANSNHMAKIVSHFSCAWV